MFRTQVISIVMLLLIATETNRSVQAQGTAAAAAAVATPEPTLWRFLGIPNGFQTMRDRLVNRRGNFPGLERREPLKAIADPANLSSPNPAIKAAAEIKQAEDMKAQKIKAIKYLATIGCGCYDKDGKITDALLAATDDCTPDVRLATVEAIEDAVNEGCCSKCGCNSCCNEKITKRLSEMGYERDNEGCPVEPVEKIRKAARRVLCKCCPGRPTGPIEEDKLEEAEEDQPELVPPPEGEKDVDEPIKGEMQPDEAIKGETSGDDSKANDGDSESDPVKGSTDSDDPAVDPFSDEEKGAWNQERKPYRANQSDMPLTQASASLPVSNPFAANIQAAGPIGQSGLTGIKSELSAEEDHNESVLEGDRTIELADLIKSTNAFEPETLAPVSIAIPDMEIAAKPQAQTSLNPEDFVISEVTFVHPQSGQLLLKGKNFSRMDVGSTVCVFRKTETGMVKVSDLVLQKVGNEAATAKVVDLKTIDRIQIGDRAVGR